jgi:hypothetical protein
VRNRRRFIALSGAAALMAGLPSPGKANVIDRNARIMVGFPGRFFAGLCCSRARREANGFRPMD